MRRLMAVFAATVSWLNPPVEPHEENRIVLLPPVSGNERSFPPEKRKRNNKLLQGSKARSQTTRYNCRRVGAR